MPDTLSTPQGRHLCDIIDVFEEWREKTGSTDMQLLLLALLDKEHEMPGEEGFLVDCVHTYS